MLEPKCVGDNFPLWESNGELWESVVQKRSYFPLTVIIHDSYLFFDKNCFVKQNKKEIKVINIKVMKAIRISNTDRSTASQNGEDFVQIQGAVS